MAQIRFANNVSTQLTKSVAADDSTIEVRSLTQGLVWPDISTAGDYFLIVIDDISSSTWEIMKCTKVQVNGDATVLTIERGLEGTTATTFNAGSVVENRLTAGTLDTFGEGFPAKVEINRGGTGATTVEEARTNLAVPSKTEVDSDISALDTKLTSAVNTKAPTYHAAADTTYGLGTDALYGHVKGDDVTTNVKDGKIVVKDVAINGNTTDRASKRGQIGNRATLSGIDYNTLVKYGHYIVEGRGSTNTPTGTATTFYVDVYETPYSALTRILQIAYRAATAHQYVRASNDSGVTWTPWEKSIYTSDLATVSTPGIMKPGDGLTVEAEGTLSVDNTVVRTSGDQTMSGIKTFKTWPIVTNPTVNRYVLQNSSLGNSRSDKPSTTSYSRLDIYNGGGLSNNINREGKFEYSKDTAGNCQTSMQANRPDNDSTEEGAAIRVGWTTSGGSFRPYTYAPTPLATSNNTEIATTKWVKDYAPVASASIAGLVKPGTGTSIAGDGSLNVDTASTSAAGIVQLSSATNSESEAVAATSKAVKAVYDKASVDVANVMSTVEQVQTQVTEAIEIDSSGYSSSQHWVRYKDGRQIIYSDWGGNFANNSTITFVKPFAINPALIPYSNDNKTLTSDNIITPIFTDITETYFTIGDWAYGSVQKSGCWVAMGTWK